MTYHNIRNMIWQLAFSGGYGAGCFVTGKREKITAHVDMIEFTYSEYSEMGEEQILCIMNHYENSYEILISVREILHSNLGLQESNLAYIKLRSTDPYEVMDVVESPGYAEMRSSIHLINHKATRKLVNRIYNRMMVSEMHKHVAENIRYELECFEKESEEKR
jgi:hypothetical protein